MFAGLAIGVGAAAIACCRASWGASVQVHETVAVGGWRQTCAGLGGVAIAGLVSGVWARGCAGLLLSLELCCGCIGLLLGLELGWLRLRPRACKKGLEFGPKFRPKPNKNTDKIKKKNQ